MRVGAIPLLAFALAVSACNEAVETEATTEVETGGAVSGDVLGGTISDDMLPLEAVTSQSPPADPSEIGDDDGASGSGETEAPE